MQTFGGVAGSADTDAIQSDARPAPLSSQFAPRRSRASRAVGPASPGDASGYWNGAIWVSLATVGIIAVRLHEPFPFLAAVRPALLISVLGVGLVLLRSNGVAIQRAFRYGPGRLVQAYFLWALLTAPLAIWRGQALTTARGLVPLLLMFLTFLLCLNSKATYERIHFGVVALIAMFAGVALWKGTMIQGRLSVGNTYDANDIAAMFAIGIPLALGMIAHSRAAGRVVILGAVLLMVVVDIKTGSRGGILALLVGCVVFAMGQRPTRRVLLVGLLAIGAMIGWTLAGEAFQGRMLSLLDIETDYNVTAQMGRLEVWKRGLDHAASSPIYGVGAGNFSVAEGQWLRSEGLTGKWSASHNAYLQALVELGVVGFLLFTGILVSFGRRAFRFWRRAGTNGHPRRPELLAALAAFCVAAFFLSLAYSYMLLCLLGLIALADRTWPTAGTRAPATESRRASRQRQPGVRHRGGVPPLAHADQPFGGFGPGSPSRSA